MSTVRDVLDSLVAGHITLEDAADDFRKRSWPPRSKTTVAQAYGIEDDLDPGPDGWRTLDCDPRLTYEQYRLLTAAAAQSKSRGYAEFVGKTHTEK